MAALPAIGKGGEHPGCSSGVWIQHGLLPQWSTHGAKEDGSELHVSMWSILKQCSRKKYTAQKYRQNETTNKMLETDRTIPDMVAL